FCSVPPHSRPTLFPYTTLFRSLMRPGRFDRQVVVPLPDIRGREQILLVHMRKVPMATDVKAEVIARGTPGFSGADLANLVNEARSEEHTSELQSLAYLVCRLLL